MKRQGVAIAIIMVCLTAGSACAEGITLFDYQGESTAYIDTDHGMRIYVGDGTPVAYLEDSSIWGFDGEHLGWFQEGIVWDHDGYAVGGMVGSVNIVTKTKPDGGIRQMAPMKSIKEMTPMEPLHRDRWSSVPLRIFLAPESE